MVNDDAKTAARAPAVEERPAGRVLTMLLDRLRQDYLAQVNEAVAAAADERGLDFARVDFDLARRVWIIPADAHRET